MAEYHHLVCGCEARVLCEVCADAWDNGTLTPTASCPRVLESKHSTQKHDVLCPMHDTMPKGVVPTDYPRSLIKRLAIRVPVYLHASRLRDRHKSEYYLDAIRTKDKVLWRFDTSNLGELIFSRREGPAIWWKRNLIR